MLRNAHVPARAARGALRRVASSSAGNLPRDGGKALAARFEALTDLADDRLGGRVLFATDEWFATADNMLKPSAPHFDPETFCTQGKVMDGWESRRRRLAGHDWAVVKLGLSGHVHGLELDTAHFTGNQVPAASVYAACIEAEDDLGSCPTAGCPFAFVWDPHNRKLDCPLCKKSFCLVCRSEPWHQGKRCEEFQAERGDPEASDAAFANFAKSQKLRQCPKCKFWVEKTSGCDAMHCRCNLVFWCAISSALTPQPFTRRAPLKGPRDHASLV